MRRKEHSTHQRQNLDRKSPREYVELDMNEDGGHELPRVLERTINISSRLRCRIERSALSMSISAEEQIRGVAMREPNKTRTEDTPQIWHGQENDVIQTSSEKSIAWMTTEGKEDT